MILARDFEIVMFHGARVLSRTPQAVRAETPEFSVFQNFSPSSTRTARAQVTDSRQEARQTESHSHRLLWLLLPSLCFPNSNKIFDCSVSSWTFCHCRYTLQLLWNKGNFLRMASKGRWSSCIYMRRCHFPSLRARTCNSILCIHVLIKKTTN